MAANFALNSAFRLKNRIGHLQVPISFLLKINVPSLYSWRPNYSDARTHAPDDPCLPFPVQKAVILPNGTTPQKKAADASEESGHARDL